jgi:ribosomal protein L19
MRIPIVESIKMGRKGKMRRAKKNELRDLDQELMELEKMIEDEQALEAEHEENLFMDFDNRNDINRIVRGEEY